MNTLHQLKGSKAKHEKHNQEGSTLLTQTVVHHTKSCNGNGSLGQTSGPTHQRDLLNSTSLGYLSVTGAV